MKRVTGLLTVAASLAAAGAWGITDAELERGFFDPPASARPHTWWHWSKEDEPLASGLLGPVVFRSLREAVRH